MLANEIVPRKHQSEIVLNPYLGSWIELSRFIKDYKG